MDHSALSVVVGAIMAGVVAVVMIAFKISDIISYRRRKRRGRRKK